MSQEPPRPAPPPRADRPAYRTVHEPLTPAQLAQLACGGLRAEIYGGVVAALSQAREAARFRGHHGLSDREIINTALSLSADAVDAFLADEMRRERRRQGLPEPE